MQKLIAGVRRFHQQAHPLYQVLSDGQSPGTLFVGCSDSRVVPAFISDAEPGDLFTIRNVGNLIPQVNEQGLSLGDHSEAAAIEYAVAILKVRDIVICGHSGCGAMTALCQDPSLYLPPNLQKWLAQARIALLDSSIPPTLGENLEPQDRLSQRNVWLQMRNLECFPSVSSALNAGDLCLHGWWFDIGRGQIMAYQESRFKEFDQVYGVQFP